MKAKNYSEYTHYISVEPSYYGSDCTQADAERIYDSLGEMVRAQFPGIDIRRHIDGDRSGATTGPVSEVCTEIDQWVSDNWIAAI